MKNINKKGFTLIELLAVIVILGVIMAIAIPSMTGYISNSRKDTMLSSAQEFINAARTLLISENALPAYGEAVVVPITTLEMDKGGVSPYTNEAFINESNTSSYVLVYNTASSAAATSSNDYNYAVVLEDKEGNCLDLVNEDFLTSATTRQKRGHIKGGFSCTKTEVLGDKGETTFTIVSKDNTTFSQKPSKVTLYK